MVTKLVKSCRKVVSSAISTKYGCLIGGLVGGAGYKGAWLGDGEGWFPQSWHYWATTPPTS